MRTINGKLYYTPKELCQILGIKVPMLAYYRRKGKIDFPYIKVMSNYLYPKDSIDKAVNNIEKGGTFHE